MPDTATRRLIVSSSAAARLNAAREWVASLPADQELLVIAPSWEAGDDFAREVTRLSGARFGLARITLDRLAANLAAPLLVRAARAPAGSFSLMAVAARAAHLLIEEGRLSYFAPVAKRPGLPPAIARTLEELRMNRVEVEAIRQLQRGGADLATFAECLDRELQSAGLADRALVFQTALNAVEAEPRPRLVGIPMMLLDVPVTSLLAADLLGALVQRSPNIIATAARGDSQSVRLLELVLHCAAESVEEFETSSLAALRTHLFEETTPPRTILDDSVNLVSWPGEARECVEIARAIQKEAARGIPFDRMAVLLRSTREYRPHVEEAFRRAWIPAYFARGTTRPDPAGRALLALLGCAVEKLSARRFAEYLSLAQVPDQFSTEAQLRKGWVRPQHDLLPGPPRGEVAEEPEPESDRLLADAEARSSVAGTLRTPWRWEQLLVDAAVIGGRDRWERRLEGLEQELKIKRDALRVEEEETHAALIERQLQDLIHLRDFALPLIDRLAGLPEKAYWSVWLDRLRELASTALRDPEGVYATLSELEPAGPVGPVDLDEVQMVLSPRLRDLQVPPPRRRYGMVFVGSAEAVRGFSFDIIFVPGLAEKLFPRKIVEDPILLDEQRQELAAAQFEAQLSTRATRGSQERLALRLAVGAARERIYLSYPRVDMEQARPRVPSFYGLEVFRAVEGVLRGFNDLSQKAEAGSTGRLGWPAPDRPEDAIDEAEYDLALLSPLMDSDEEANVGTASYLLTSNPHLGRALRARGRRWLRRWTPSDGLVDGDDLAAQALARHQLTARSFSPTGLQNFAICPYRFLLQAIHRLAPREEPIALEVLDPLTRGALFHDAQFLILTKLKGEGLLPLALADLERALHFVDRIVDHVSRSYAERLAPAIPRVWDDAINSIRADLREWLRRMAEEPDGWVPHRFELAFGLADRHRSNADPASVPNSVEIVGGLRLRGSIDLVERNDKGVLRATDHKTGKAWARPGVILGAGKVLQPVLYALACEQMLGEPVEAGRLYYCTADGGYEERVVPLDDYSRGAANIVVEVIGRALAEGFLPALPDKGACEMCDYRMVCGPYEETRTARKPIERLADMQKLRSLP